MTSFFEFREKMMGKSAEAPPAPVAPKPTTGPNPLTVSQLTAQIDRVIRGGMPADVLVRGECSNAHAHRESGHFYFTLKDAKACIDCMMYRDDYALLGFEPVDGIELLATGSIKVFAQRGRYQLYAKTLEPLGKGALELAFQKLRKKLEQEGLFDPARKKPLPRYPIDIAIITGRATAAVHDIAKVLRRFPWLKPRLINVPVQGDGAANRIAGAIEHVNRRGRGKTDVILLGRGGGSLEDLWQFNDENLARAIAASTIPIITGIGHEVDTTIADLVADYHAHTPTEAAQVITIHWRQAPDEVNGLAQRLRGAMRHIVNDARHRLNHIERHETFRRPTDHIRALHQAIDDRQRALALALSDHLNDLRRQLHAYENRLESHRPARTLARLRQHLTDASDRLCHTAMRRLRVASALLARGETKLVARHPRHAIKLHAQRLDNLAERLRCTEELRRQRRTLQLDALERQLNAVSPQAVLKRGYSMTLLKKTGAVVKSVTQVTPGDPLITRVGDGEFESTAEDSRQPKLFE